MGLRIYVVSFLMVLLTMLKVHGQKSNVTQVRENAFANAADFGFSPNATGIENAKALQKAVDKTGTIVVSAPGTYKMAATVYIGSNTSLIFGNNVFLKKIDEQGVFSHVILNKGALTKTYDEHISVEGLNIIVNGMDTNQFKEAYGLRGQLAFFYIKDLKVDRFRCLDIGKMQFGIHVCTFEDIIINDVVIKGDKDGVHLGRGKRFVISNGVFQCYDDAIALNAQDYSTSNPELGWIEDGLVQNCHDLNAEKTTGYFCRLAAGAWIDWKPGMEVQQSDAVVSNGRIYRVQNKPDGKKYTSLTKPTHESGKVMLDSINWGVVQNDVIYTAGVRNVIFRDIFLNKPRTAFSVHFDNDKFNRSYYPGAEIPHQEHLTFDNIRILYDNNIDFLEIGTPMDVLTITNSSFRNNQIKFWGNKAMTDYGTTRINMIGCVFNQKGVMALINNTVDGKNILLKTSSSVESHKEFSAKIVTGNGKITVESDLTGLKK